jgi:hypothetical protein
VGDHYHKKDIPFYEGPHMIRALKQATPEISRANNQFYRLFTEVFRLIGKLLNDLPDYDSGYFKIEAGQNTYHLDHEFGSVPKRATIYFKSDQPDNDLDYVQHMVHQGECLWRIRQCGYGAFPSIGRQ